MDYVLNHWQLIGIILAVIVLSLCYRWVLALCRVILVPDDSVGVRSVASKHVTENRCQVAASLRSWWPAMHFRTRARSSRTEVRGVPKLG